MTPSDDTTTATAAPLFDVREFARTARGSHRSELDLSDVEPTAHPLDLVNVWAEDEPRPSLPVDEALANAPDRQDGFFKVPPA